jgi:hypothetical protein
MFFLLCRLPSLAMAMEWNAIIEAWDLTQGIQWFLGGGLICTDFGPFDHSMMAIIFHLLIFFMVATVLKDSTCRFDVSLPDARSGQVAETRRLTIEMTADGAISFNGDLVTQEQLEQQQQPMGGAKANGRW